MTKEEKAKAYDEAIKRAKKELNTCGSQDCDAAKQIFRFFPELKESEDEKIRKELLEYCINRRDGKQICVDASDYRRWADWLEKQGKNNRWKPSKDEMDALYGLAYITNKMDDKKDVAITKLYQDLKREFFNGLIGLVENSKAGLPINLRGKAADKCIDWLKSLKPHWKPSIEQLNALKQCIGGYYSEEAYEQLGSLYNDLKKL